MDFVGQYNSKRKLAEQLRRREDALAQQAFAAPSQPLYTPESGSFPGQMGVNWGGALGQLGAALLAKRAGDKATAAEDESTAARRDALAAILGTGGAGGNGVGAQSLTPEKALQLQELNIDPRGLSEFMPKKTPAAVIAQGANSPASIDALVAIGELTPEQGQQMKQGIADRAKAEREQAREDFLWEQRNTYRAPTTERKPTAFEEYQEDPEGYAKFQEAQARIKAGMAGPKDDEYVKTFKRKQAEQDVNMINNLPKLELSAGRVDELGKDAWNGGNELWVKDLAGSLVGLKGEFKPSSRNKEVQIQTQKLNQFRLDAMEQMRGFGQVTEAEQAILAGTLFDIYDHKEARDEKLRVMKQALASALAKGRVAAERARARNAFHTVGNAVITNAPGGAPKGPEDLDSEIDSLMGGP